MGVSEIPSISGVSGVLGTAHGPTSTSFPKGWWLLALITTGCAETPKYAFSAGAFRKANANFLS